MSAGAALAYLGAGVVASWGVAHAIPTRTVVAGFGEISADHRLIVTQEWLVEALTLWFIAAVVVLTTALAGSSVASAWVDRTGAVMLVAVAVLTTATGARTPIVWFRICPILLSSAAVLFLVASWL